MNKIIDISYEAFIERYRMQMEDEPVCPFPGGGECWLKTEERNCKDCDICRQSYKKQLTEKIMQDRKAHNVIKGRGARVFCVSCGAGKRTPLRKWHNSYICQSCWKMLNAIGEEEFIKRIKGE